MALTVQLTSDVVTGDAYTPSATGDDFLLAAGSTYGSSDSAFFDGFTAGIDITLLGNGFSGDQGIYFFGEDGYLYIGPDGSFTSYESVTGNSAVYLGGDGGFFVNDGALNAPQAHGVLVLSDSSVTNNGSIVSATPVFFGESTGSFINTGVVSATDTSTIASAENGNGVTLREGTYTVTNLEGGVITNVAEDRAGIFITGASDGTRIDNYGQIVSHNGTGVDASAMVAGNAMLLANTGLIRGDFIALEGSSDADVILNSGQMIGDVILGGGADTYDGRGGIVNGQVFGGSGDDSYLLTDGETDIVELMGEGTDTVLVSGNYALGDNVENLQLGGATDAKGVGNTLANNIIGNAGDNRLGGNTGNDTLDGGAGDDSVYGGGGDDLLSGGDGDDWMSSGAANDTILGEDGNDVLMGQRGSDLLNGGDGSDVLIGGSGNDTLAGGREDDTLIGGEGSDQLNGASGIDTFVWNNVGESLNSGARDRITGYEAGLDVLDFTCVLPGAFDINIGAGFTAGGVASIRTFEAGGVDTRVFVDVDGNGTTDMRVDIFGATGLTALDFAV